MIVSVRFFSMNGEAPDNSLKVRLVGPVADLTEGLHVTKREPESSTTV